MLLIIQAGVTPSNLFLTQTFSFICVFAFISLCVMADTAKIFVMFTCCYFY